MLRVLSAALLSASCLAGASASAATSEVLPTQRDAAIVLVDGGCGPGGFRDRFGYCRPKPIYRRFCPPGFHGTPYGCRPNY